MTRYDENDVARRLGEPAPPPPPDLAARLKAAIPNRVVVPPALTRPAAGTLPFIHRPLGRRLVALAAILVLGVVFNLVARRVVQPPAGPLEVALVESPAGPESEAAPVADAAATLLRQAPPAAPAEPAASAGPQDRATGKRETTAPPQPFAAAVRQPAADVVATVSEPRPPAVVGGVAAPAAGEAESLERDVFAARAANGVTTALIEKAAAPAEESGPVYRVGGPVTAPEPVELVEPEFSEALRAADARGDVVIEAVIDRAGAVVKPRVVKNMTGSQECADAALAAVRRWRYRPALFEGRPVAVTMTLTVVFEPGRAAPATATPTP